MTKDNRTLLMVFVAVCVLGCLGTGVVAFVMIRSLNSFGGGGEWSSTAVAERDLPRLYGVRLPTAPLKWDSRAMGFQDGIWEVLVQLPPESRDAFLTMNKLELTDIGAGFEDDTLQRIRELDPSTPKLKSQRVRLPEATTPDGGGWYLYRSAVMYEGEGVFWLYLSAHEN